MGAKKLKTPENKTEVEKKMAPNLRLWNKSEAMDFLQLPASTFNLHLAKGSIPYLKIGRHVRFLPEQLMAWAKKQTA